MKGTSCPLYWFKPGKCYHSFEGSKDEKKVEELEKLRHTNNDW